MKSNRRFVSRDLPSERASAVLSAEVSHHLLRVVGIAPGEHFELISGAGEGCVAQLVRVCDGRAEVSFVHRITPVATRRELHLLIATTRQQAFSTALRMATELGVTAIKPVLTERCVVRNDRSDRWLKILQSAAAQSKRLVIPSITPLMSLPDAIAAVEEYSLRLVFAPGAPMVEVPERFPFNEAIAILIGPEVHSVLHSHWSRANDVLL